MKGATDEWIKCDLGCMSNTAVLILSWSLFALHVVAGLATLRRWIAWPLLPTMNVLIAVCLLAYWLPKWFRYAMNGILWFGSDQWIAVYAMVVLVLGVLTLTGRWHSMAVQWIVFGIHTLVMLAAAVFFTVFRMDRLI